MQKLLIGGFMAKRTVILFLLISVMSASLVFRIAYVADTYSVDADSQKCTRIVNVASTRGMIYDRNMLPLVNAVTHNALFVNPTDSAIRHLQNVLSDAEYLKIQPKLMQGKPFVFMCESYDSIHEDITQMNVYDRYDESALAVHLTGYTDYEDKGVTGIEKDFQELLNEYSGTLSVRYNVTSSGKMLRGLGCKIISDNYLSQGGIVLTIDKEIQRVCEDAMKRNGMQKGAVVVLNVESGEILALASYPEFDRKNLTESLRSDDSPFLNRALEAYPVGSVFKPVVAVAALEKGISPGTQFYCDGKVNISGIMFNCHEHNGHGMIDMTQAMAVSCNSYFIQLGQLVGSEKILQTASSLGFGHEYALSDTIINKKGNLPYIDSSASLANLSFGQGSLLATPLQIASLYRAFANGGYYREPYLFENMIDADGEVFAFYEPEPQAKVISDSINDLIKRMLEKTVSDGSGMLAKPMCCDAAGKTATAETGKTKNGKKTVHTWFSGYFPSDKPEYVITVFREDGNYSSKDCAPVFRDIADGITGLK